MTSEQDVQTTIHEALQSARFNEAVIVSVSDNNDNSREIVLVACLDREHGGIVWRDAAAAAAAINKPIDDNTPDQDDVGIVRHLRTKLWAVPMLNDHIRNEMYNRSVRNACRAVVQKRMHDPDDVDGVIRILDIGSGTGLIAMMALKHCQDAIVDARKSQPEKQMKVQVTSCEMASAMSRLARKTIHENESSHHEECGIVIVESHSTDKDFVIKDSRFNSDASEHPQKADICTSELLDSTLLGEGVLPSLRDAWERHLKPDATVLPKSARVVAVLVEGCPVANKQMNSHDSGMNGVTAFYGPQLKSFKHNSGGVWLATTPQSSHSNETSDDGVLLGAQCHDTSISDNTAAAGIRIPVHAEAILNSQHRDTSLADPLQEYDGYYLADATDNEKETSVSVGLRQLSSPKTVLTLDFASGLNAFPPPSGQSVSTEFNITTSGSIDGVLFWWELDLDESNTYSTEPTDCLENEPSDTMSCKINHWQDHWQQCLFLFGDDHQSREVEKGCSIHVIASNDDFSISFDVADDNVINSRLAIRRKLNDTSTSLSVNSKHQYINTHISHARALQLNDSKRTAILRDSILHAIDKKGTNASVLDLSDMGICAIIAAVAGKAKCVTSLESGMATLAATISQLGNGLPYNESIFQVIQALSENVTIDYIAGGPAEIVLAEPYYQLLEGYHIQEALNYYYLIKSFKTRGLISETAVSVPSFACIMGCVVEFKDFTDAYGSVGDKNAVSGFQHTAVNHYGNRYHTYDVSLPLWQYKFKRLSHPFCIAEVMYEGMALGIKDDYWASAKFEKTGNADAVIFWVDYLCRSSSGTHTQTSTNDRFNVISTASSTHRQMVRKLSKSKLISESDLQNVKFTCRSKFDKEDDNDSVDQDHSFSYKFVRES
eukprot:scaffold1963_cov63-Cyclotella_meneghiniana.AAC.5